MTTPTFSGTTSPQAYSKLIHHTLGVLIRSTAQGTANILTLRPGCTVEAKMDAKYNTRYTVRKDGVTSRGISALFMTCEAEWLAHEAAQVQALIDADEKARADAKAVADAKAAPVVVAFKAGALAMTFTWYAGREMWSAQVETTTGGSTHWWMTPAEMHAWVAGRGYSAQFAQAHAEAVEAAAAPVGVVPAVVAQTYEVCAPVPAFPEAPSVSLTLTYDDAIMLRRIVREARDHHAARTADGDACAHLWHADAVSLLAQVRAAIVQAQCVKAPSHV